MTKHIFNIQQQKSISMRRHIHFFSEYSWLFTFVWQSEAIKYYNDGDSSDEDDESSGCDKSESSGSTSYGSTSYGSTSDGSTSDGSTSYGSTSISDGYNYAKLRSAEAENV